MKLDSEDHDNHDRFNLGAGFYLHMAKPHKDTVSQHQDRIQAAAKRVPRFLFRFWDEESGGPGVYNTKQAITPRAFANGRNADLMFNMQQAEFDSIATDHVAGYDTDTVFSSWSQTLSTVLRMAVSRNRKKTHICILDTKLLGSHNVVVSTVTANEICSSVDVYHDEFLIYGVIRGRGYTAIPLRKIDKIRSFLSNGRTPDCKTWKACISDTYEIVHESKWLSLFWHVPFAAHLLNLHDPDHAGSCARERRDHRIWRLLEVYPTELLYFLADDPLIMEPGYASTYGFHEADRAHEAMRKLIFETYGEKVVRAMQERCRVANEADETPYEREQRYQGAQDQHKRIENNSSTDSMGDTTTTLVPETLSSSEAIVTK